MTCPALHDPVTLFAVAVGNVRVKLTTKASRAHAYAESCNDNKVFYGPARVVRLVASFRDPAGSNPPDDFDDNVCLSLDPKGGAV